MASLFKTLATKAVAQGKGLATGLATKAVAQGKGLATGLATKAVAQGKELATGLLKDAVAQVEEAAQGHKTVDTSHVSMPLTNAIKKLCKDIKDSKETINDDKIKQLINADTNLKTLLLNAIHAEVHKGGARKKNSSKKRASKKGSSKKRASKKGSSKKRASKKGSSKKRTSKKSSSKK
jgi:hypothetical protein